MKNIVWLTINFLTILICFISPATGGNNIREDTDTPFNTWAGNSAGNGTSTGDHNSFFGAGAGMYVTTGSYNSYFGAIAGRNTTEGGNNSCFGYKAGIANTTAGSNSFFGAEAGNTTNYVDANNTGDGNSFFGYEAGYKNTGGSYNVFIGFKAGYNNTTGSNSVFLGYKAGYNETASYRLYIDNCRISSVKDCDTPLIYGEFDTGLVNINGSLALTNVSYTSDIRLKKDIRPLTESLAKIMQLKGVSYDWKSDEYPGRGFAKGRQIGLIAQDVEATIPEVVTTARGGYKAISYNKLLPVLVEAFKEQQKTVEQQKSAINREGKLLDEREVVISEQKRQLDKNRLLIDKQQPEIEKRRQMLAELGMKVDALEAALQRLRSRDLTAGTIMDGRIGQ